MNENVYKDYEQCLKIVSKEAERLNAEAVRDAQFHFARELRKK